MKFEIMQIAPGPEVYQQGLRWVVWDRTNKRTTMNGWFRQYNEARLAVVKLEKKWGHS